MDEEKIYEQATNILLELKIQPEMLGFDYLRKSIELCVLDEDLINNITTKLYPMVGKYFSVKSSIIERCIRNAINQSYKSKGLLGLNNVYNTIIYKNDYKPSNSELISIIVEKIKLDLLKDNLNSQLQDEKLKKILRED